METSADEYARFTAYGNQMISVHAQLRHLLDDLRAGIVPATELYVHCLAFCSAVTRHHTSEDTTVFPLLAARHPELRGFLDSLKRDHQMIAYLLTRLERAAGTPAADAELDGIAAVLETHFIGEEKRLVGVLNALDTALGPIGLDDIEDRDGRDA